MRLAAEGDEQAFTQLFTRYYSQLYHLVHRFALAEEEIHEAIQETFLSVWIQRDELVNIENLRGWLLRIAARKCRRLMERNLVEKRTRNAVTNFTPGVSDGDNPAEVRELRKIIEEAVEQLSGQRKIIFTLSRQEGLKPAEIADKLNLSVSTVKNTLVAALQQIRKQLSDAGYNFSIFFLLCLVRFYIS